MKSLVDLRRELLRTVGILGITLLPWLMAQAGSELARPAPALVALVLMVWLRQALLALLLAAWSGALVQQAATPWWSVFHLIEHHLLPCFFSRWNICAILFTLLAGGLVAVIEHGGSLQAWIDRAAGSAARASARRLQGATFTFGLLCFFDGLANAMLAGRLFRPLYDRAGVPRVVLAWIVDSTSAPVACIAFISTWIAFQLTLIRDGFAAAGMNVNPYSIYAASVPMNFYCGFALLLVALAIATQWLPAVMRQTKAHPSAVLPPQEAACSHPRLLRGLLPLSVLIGGILIGLYVSGAGWIWPSSLPAVADAFGEADTALVLLLASLAAAFCSVTLHPRPSQATQILFRGMTSLLPAVGILIGAWMLGSVLKELDVPQWLARNSLIFESSALMPATVFSLAAVVSFFTGTSWGTMGVLMPLFLPSALSLEVQQGLTGEQIETVGALVTAAIFSGAVFGDHCSPLSDTTIVSAAASGVDPWEHTWTQLPFALLAAGVALGAGFLPLGAGVHPLIGWLGGALILLAVCGLAPRWKFAADGRCQK